MIENENIDPVNSKGCYEGFCVLFYTDGISEKGVYVDGVKYGYHIVLDRNDVVCEWLSGCYLDHELISRKNESGYCYVWNNKEVKQ
jgi:hypothetical protein